MIKLLLAIQWSLIIVAVCIDVIFRDGVYPPEISDYLNKMDNSELQIHSIILASFGAMAYIIGSVGIWCHKSWGLTFYIIGQLLLLSLIPIMVVYIVSGVSGILTEVSMMAIGATIILALNDKGFVSLKSEK